MADSTPDLHPTVKQFKQKLEKRVATSADRSQLQKFREGKCPPEFHAICDELLARYDREKADNEKNLTAAHQRAHAPAEPSWGSGWQKGGPSRAPSKGDNSTAAHPSKLGEPFHNPYTFIPFGQSPRRAQPTLHTADETERDRFTGVLRLRVRTLSPLLSCLPSAGAGGTHAAITLGDDAIVPATGVRGALRTLMTVLTGGTLGYIDPMLWLTQGRDANLGPAGKNSPQRTPSRAFLARVTRVGNVQSSGEVELNAAHDPLVPMMELEREFPNLRELRPAQSKSRGVVQGRGDVLYKLSGRPIQQKGKREGVFKPSGRTLQIPAERWAEYNGRHAHADFGELKVGDLVWLEPASPDLTELKQPSDVRSIQWARWGRRGARLVDLIRQKHGAVLPDSMAGDGLVDEVTNLFGQIPDASCKEAARTFAARVRCDNLVFRGAAKARIDRGVWLAPLMQPHPGCVGFYRDNSDLDDLSREDVLRGYKVYRTTRERGQGAPWHYATQGVYDDHGKLDNEKRKTLSRQCDLLQEGSEGELSIAVRSLSSRELALLLAACSVDWRLGGGKPLGLGHCRITDVEIVSEFGETVEKWSPAAANDPLDRAQPAALPARFAAQVSELAARLLHFQATQRPVERLRYPRAVKRNQNRSMRGGNAWFQRHASPKKAETDGGIPQGLQVFRVGGNLAQVVGATQVKAQALPPFNPKDPFADVLYGYDCVTDDVEENRMSVAIDIKPFNESRDVRPTDKSGGPQGQSQETRRAQRDQR
jgi:hypothetical protein